MNSIETCLNKINDNTNYNDLTQQVITKAPYVYTFNTINDRNDKIYPENTSIRFQKNGYLNSNYNKLVDDHSKLLNIDHKLTKDLHNNLSDNAEFNKLPNINTDLLYSENTRFNKNCGLKEFGINRWYNLYKNPTENSIEPFNRIGLNTINDNLDEYSNVCYGI